MIRFDRMGVRYADTVTPTLTDVTAQIPEGELALVIGRTGAGKSTLLRTINGLVPHFSGGTLTGSVRVDGRDTREHRPRDLADVVGFVGQDPQAGFVTDRVEDELAYGMESLGVPGQTMRKRVEETLDLLGLAELRRRALSTLSGGQRQRVAIGSVLVTHPRVLVLDEPTSALDPQAAEEVLAALQRLVHDLGLTVVIAEHRLERVVQYADSVLWLPGGGEPIVTGPPAQVMELAPVAPPVVELARWAGWSPLPLSIRDARRTAGPLREQMASAAPPTAAASTAAAAQAAELQAASVQVAEPLTCVENLVVRYGEVPALRGVQLTTRPGEVAALMGRNGAGKSTLLATIAGLVTPASGRVAVAGVDPSDATPQEWVRRVGLVPQDPLDLLYADTVAAECAEADRDASAVSGACRALLERFSPGVPLERHPRDLSEGQRLSLVLAIVLTGQPTQVLLDEPTRGLDYAAKRALVSTLKELAAEGRAVTLATHDVELVAELADRVVVLADGDVVADGPTAEVIGASPAFAPQVAKILGDGRWLTVADVRAAVGAAS